MIIGPGTELEGAVLLVEGEVLYLNFAGTLVDGRGQPLDAAIGTHNDVGVDRYLIGPISTGAGQDIEEKTITNLQRKPGLFLEPSESPCGSSASSVIQACFSQQL